MKKNAGTWLVQMSLQFFKVVFWSYLVDNAHRKQKQNQCPVSKFLLALNPIFFPVLLLISSNTMGKNNQFSFYLYYEFTSHL